VNLPIGLGLLALTGIGPVIAWRKASRRNLIRNFAFPTLMGAGVLVGFLIAGVTEVMPLLTFGIATFVMTIIAVEFWKGTRARARIEGEGLGLAFVHLVSRNRRRWGGYIVHAGVVLIFTAFAGQSFDREVRETLNIGESVSIASPFGHTYALTYEGISSSRPPNMWQWVALLSVERDGEPVGRITTEKRQYITTQQLVTEVGIRSTPVEDLYVILESVEDIQGMVRNEAGSQRATIKVLVNPLVGWIWYGGILLTVGTLIALWPGQEAFGRRRVAAEEEVAEVATVES
jgi:cytochrome c-type biogenesis protein CcmF